MRLIIVVLLLAQVLIFGAAAYSILTGRTTNRRGRPIWASLAVGLILVTIVSFSIADRHIADDGAEFLQFGGAFLLGMGVFALLLHWRECRGRR